MRQIRNFAIATLAAATLGACATKGFVRRGLDEQRCEPIVGSPEDALERRTATKLELLHAVVLTLGDRNRIVKA